jgi:signal transduction histidine kinase
LYQKLEDARSHARSMLDYERAIDAALDEAQGLLETFSALLRIAQVEGASPRTVFTELDLTSVTETVVDAYRLDAEGGGRSITADISPDVVVSGDQELLTQALANLIENALCHTPPGTQITVRLEGSRESGAVLSVADNGPGVAEADLPRLTDRFYRGERSRTTPGNGLGLSLVAAVAELHGAKLRLTPMEPGLRAEVSFTPVGLHWIVVPDRESTR